MRVRLPALVEAERHAREVMKAASVEAGFQDLFLRWQNLGTHIQFIREDVVSTLGIEVGKRLGGGR